MKPLLNYYKEYIKKVSNLIPQAKELGLEDDIIQHKYIIMILKEEKQELEKRLKAYSDFTLDEAFRLTKGYSIPWTIELMNEYNISIWNKHKELFGEVNEK